MTKRVAKLWSATAVLIVLAGPSLAGQSFTSEKIIVPTYVQEDEPETATPVTVTRGIVPYVKQHHRWRRARHWAPRRRALRRLRRREVSP